MGEIPGTHVDADVGLFLGLASRRLGFVSCQGTRKTRRFRHGRSSASSHTSSGTSLQVSSPQYRAELGTRPAGQKENQAPNFAGQAVFSEKNPKKRNFQTSGARETVTSHDEEAR